MPLLMRHRLSIPALLAASALGCGADDDDDDATSVADTSSTSDSDSSTGPTSDPTTDPSTDPTTETSATEASSGESSSEGGTTSATDSGTESADTGSTTGVEMCFGDGSMPACDVETQRECEAVEICLWVKPGYCSANCSAITDSATCCEQFECAWMDGACDYGAI